MSVSQKIVLASGNAGKLREFQQLLANVGLEVLPQSNFSVPDADETGLSFVENAILKARHAARITGLPALADDSGLEVDALHGAPGIYSSRYASLDGEDWAKQFHTDNKDHANNLKLLDALEGLPVEKRGARFQCVLAFMRHAEDPTPLICQASWEGHIVEELAGAGGFGYDPLFFVHDKGCTSAELAKDKKNRISHRGQALQQLLQALPARLST